MRNLVIALQGMVMGIVETIPGVSGSTMALIMGIYDNFVDLLHGFSDVGKEIAYFVVGKSTIGGIKGKFLEVNWKFGTPLLLGMALGIVVFSHIMSYLLENHTAYTLAFFFGLVMASVFVPLKQLEKITFMEYGLVFLSSLVFFVILGLSPAELSGRPGLLRLFVGGFVGICSMILPGISGSFVLLLFGVYNYVISSVKDITSFNFEIYQIIDLFVVALGILFGFAIFVRILKKALKTHRSIIMAGLSGLMIASLRVLWPFVTVQFDETGHVVTQKVLPAVLGTNNAIVIIVIALVTFSLTLGMQVRLKKS